MLWQRKRVWLARSLNLHKSRNCMRQNEAYNCLEPAKQSCNQHAPGSNIHSSGGPPPKVFLYGLLKGPLVSKTEIINGASTRNVKAEENCCAEQLHNGALACYMMMIPAMANFTPPHHLEFNFRIAANTMQLVCGVFRPLLSVRPVSGSR